LKTRVSFTVFFFQIIEERICNSTILAIHFERVERPFQEVSGKKKRAVSAVQM
jgi:hypothetical protein